MSNTIDTIDSLRNMLKRDGFESYYAALTALVADRCALRIELDRELAAAIKQRDEARELNKAWEQKAATWLATPEAAARLQGYRDLGQQVAKAQNDLDACRAELAAAIKQRDEARREACLWSHPKGIVWTGTVLERAKAIAAERGWDCFKEGGGA